MSYNNGYFPNDGMNPYAATPRYTSPMQGYQNYMPQTSPYYPGSTKASMVEYQQQAAYQQQQQQLALKGRPVSSVEEAKAAQIDFDGSLFIFPNVAGNEIYTRKFGQDGLVAFNTYALVDSNTPKGNIEQVQTQVPNYVTYDQLEKTVSELKKKIENDVLDIIASAEGVKHDGSK